MVAIALQPGAKPVYKRLGPAVPHALKQQVEAELDHLEQKGIRRLMEHSSWASPSYILCIIYIYTGKCTCPIVQE